MTSILKDKRFRLFYDNRRQIIEPKDFTEFDMSEKLFDSKALFSDSEALELRFKSKMPFNLPYNIHSHNTGKSRSTYKTYLVFRAWCKRFYQGVLC